MNSATVTVDANIVLGDPGRDEPTNLPDVEIDRLVPLETWLHENRRMRSIWRHGSPRLREPADMSKWLRRHEARLTKCGAVMRLGKAWRIVEPAFRTVLFEILTEERDVAMRRKEKKC